MAGEVKRSYTERIEAAIQAVRDYRGGKIPLGNVQASLVGLEVKDLAVVHEFTRLRVDALMRIRDGVSAP